jgi:hypothetical protein
MDTVRVVADKDMALIWHPDAALKKPKAPNGSPPLVLTLHPLINLPLKTGVPRLPHTCIQVHSG